MNWNNEMQITRTDNTEKAVSGVANDALTIPTLSPTFAPTDPPSRSPTIGILDCFDMGYTHSPDDIQFLAVAQSGSRGCRWGLMEDWPGGQSTEMCDSPYVVCLPEANTPNVGFPTDTVGEIEPYKTTTAQYTLEECKRECAYDQRCNGFEFYAAAAGPVGRCNLIDDIPVVAVGSGSSALPLITTEDEYKAAPFSDIENVATCFEKQVGCNPYFKESELNDVMLKCYCPNNRKVFYTKNVKRTVAATKFCGNDPDGAITKRIREAQANRMFHLCENWCLFNTQNPRTESWYHDPWGASGNRNDAEACWREQYAGVGTHRSYCYRVIRDPFTIEQYFIDQRSAGMCTLDDDGVPNGNTPSPTWGTVTTDKWVLADSGDSCDDACDDEGLICNAEDTASVLNSMGDSAGTYFTQAGYSCTTFTQSDEVSPNSSDGWALPGVGPDGDCILRHENTNKGELLYNGCNVALGFGYQRLCA